MNSWVLKRFEHLGEDGMPSKMSLKFEEGEQNYDEPARVSDKVLKECEDALRRVS